MTEFSNAIPFYQSRTEFDYRYIKVKKASDAAKVSGQPDTSCESNNAPCDLPRDDARTCEHALEADPGSVGAVTG